MIIVCNVLWSTRNVFNYMGTKNIFFYLGFMLPLKCCLPVVNKGGKGCIFLFKFYDPSRMLFTCS